MDLMHVPDSFDISEHVERIVYHSSNILSLRNSSEFDNIDLQHFWTVKNPQPETIIYFTISLSSILNLLLLIY